jgi:protein-tyrosine phosphatase
LEVSIQVLFVCLGNICRSPIAEGTFQALVVSKKLDHIIQCDSAGTASYHTGALPDKRMRQVAHQNGITLTHHARQFQSTDPQKFQYILAMDESNYKDIRRIMRSAQAPEEIEEQLFLYRKFDPQRGEELSVPDPYYGGISGFEEVYAITERCAKAFLDFLVEKHDLTYQ